MNALQHASAFKLPARLESFCELRSDFIDEFARLEIAVGLGLVRLGLGLDARKSTFSQCLDRLSKARPSCQLSKKNAATLAEIARDCEPLQRIRASVVHAVMTLGTRADEPVAAFRNVADVVSGEPFYCSLSASELHERIGELRAIRRRVETSLSPS